MRGWHCLALAGALSLPVAPAAAAVKQAAADAAPATGDSAREQALQAFQHDLVSVLALRATAQPLLGAALLARPLPRQPKTNSFHALINRAAAASDAGPAVQWARLADCDAKADACPNASALRKLVEQAPDNAAVWLLKLGLDTRDMKSDAARADLARAAAAKLYDDYTGSSLAALAGVVDALPPPPALPVVAKLCENAGDDAAIKADCLRLGKLLEWGSSPLARSLGLHLRDVLGDATAQADARQQRRDLIWQVQN